MFKKFNLMNKEYKYFLKLSIWVYILVDKSVVGNTL